METLSNRNPKKAIIKAQNQCYEQIKIVNDFEDDYKIKKRIGNEQKVYEEEQHFDTKTLIKVEETTDSNLAWHSKKSISVRFDLVPEK